MITPQTYRNPRYPYRPAPAREARHPVVIVGAGLVGLTLAVDLALRGVASVVIDDDDTVSVGSRAICWAKRTLEIFDRLGLGQRLVDKGVTWNLGKVFHRERTLYDFNLLPEAGHSRPAFVNLQQYYVEEWLVARAAELPLIDLRWKHRLVGLDQDHGGVTARVETPEGRYELAADWLVACDGARSPTRDLLGLAFEGRVFRDRFLIADLLMEADYPAERWFWFDPPFHRGQSVLLHKQADRVWRIDFQLGPDADPELEKDPARVTARLAAMLGPERRFSLEWVSVYSFKCRRLARFRQDRVLFAGDSAHQVSPFGARGGNSGVQDAENLAWKLAALLRGEAPEALLDSYEAERIPAADENLLHSTRATDFITPKSPASRAYRDAVLELAAEAPFARALINSGRLSRPASYQATPLSTPDAAPFEGGLPPGVPALDAPVTTAAGEDWLLRQLGPDFTLLSFDPAASAPPGVALLRVGVELQDHAGLLARRYGAGSSYLLRPDRHVAARWPRFDAAAVAAALDRALARR